jgi:hypothetical protein
VIIKKSISDFFVACPDATDPDKKIARTPGKYPQRLAHFSAFFINF